MPASAPVGEYAGWYWQRVKNEDPKNAKWREYHDQRYGQGFEYPAFAPQFTAHLLNGARWADVFQRKPKGAG